MIEELGLEPDLGRTDGFWRIRRIRGYCQVVAATLESGVVRNVAQDVRGELMVECYSIGKLLELVRRSDPETGRRDAGIARVDAIDQERRVTVQLLLFIGISYPGRQVGVRGKLISTLRISRDGVRHLAVVD